MNLKEDVLPVSYVKSHAAEVLKQVNDNHRPVFVTQKGLAKAVILDTGSYENLVNAVSVLKLINESEQSLKSGQFKSHQDVKTVMEQKLSDLRKRNG